MTSKIDLSKYVGKKVRVTFNNKRTQEVFISLGDNSLYPYKIGSSLFDKHGRRNFITNLGHIIHIEEIQMNNYQELENKVKELQAEIDRLKAQEQKQKEVLTFKDEIEEVLQTFHGTDPYNNLYNLVEDYTNKICEIVKSYIPVPQIEREDYDHGYNDAIHKVKKNLGLDT